MSEYTVRASRRHSGGFGFGAAALSTLCFAVARTAAEVWLVAGIAVFLGLIALGAALILAYRFIVNPVMIRMSQDGIWVKRLGVTIPWVAMDRIERVTFADTDLLSIVERARGHPVFDEQPLILGAALNAKAGLPPLAISPSGLVASVDEIEKAIEMIAPGTVRHQPD